MKLSEPIPLDLTPQNWVYRLWNADGDCLYVGQHKGIHPVSCVRQHRTQQPWWHEVARADYVEVLEGELDIAEKQQIHDLNPRYNKTAAFEALQRHNAAVAGEIPRLFTTAEGQLNQRVHLWDYESQADRETRRAAMQADRRRST